MEEFLRVKEDLLLDRFERKGKDLDYSGLQGRTDVTIRESYVPIY